MNLLRRRTISEIVDTFIPRFLLPRKELLAGISPAVAASSLGLYIAISDANTASASGVSTISAVSLIDRMQLTRLYLAAGRDAVRAVAAVAEYDRNAIPESKITKTDAVQARSLYEVAGRTLNDCIASLCSLDMAIERLDEALKLAAPIS
jgi:hypothetical protein